MSKALPASRSPLDRHRYYETICGGAGAGPGYHGACAVHTHLTNTRVTDPEIMGEQRFQLSHRWLIRSVSVADR